MTSDNHEKVYGVLLDIQKQIGDVKGETSRQSQMLIDLNAKVAIQNGRITTNEKDTARLKEWRKYVLGGLAVLGLGGSIGATLYIKYVATEAAKQAISALEDKYDINIHE